MCVAMWGATSLQPDDFWCESIFAAPGVARCDLHAPATAAPGQLSAMYVFTCSTANMLVQRMYMIAVVPAHPTLWVCVRPPCFDCFELFMLSCWKCSL